MGGGGSDGIEENSEELGFIRETISFPGVSVKLLWRDAQGPRFTALYRLTPGARLPRHRHLGVEQTFVLQGSLVDEQGVCAAGNFVSRRPGSIHTAHSPDGCLAIGIFQAPNEFLDEE